MTLQHFTIADLQRALHEGELSAREIARQTLDDIARVNPADQRLDRGHRPAHAGGGRQHRRPAPEKRPPCRRWQGFLTQ
ncbi:hypothetical protein LNQ03_30210 [Klebsiella pneumoniae subsp. pneumoniae]|nr:hypothetical protein [Klebsiella pneumoniae subsp. pneumoniae]